MHFKKIFLSLCLAASLLWAQQPAEEESEGKEAQTEEYELIIPSPPKKRTFFGWTEYGEIAYNRFLGAPDTLKGSLEGLGSISSTLISSRACA